VQDVCIAVCDELKGLPEAITTTWELATVQACVIHLIRNTFRFASRKYWEEVSRAGSALQPIFDYPGTAALYGLTMLALRVGFAFVNARPVRELARQRRSGLNVAP
jgi:hypothetical protein